MGNELLDDRKRRRLLFRWLNGILALVAGFMSAVNVFTGEYTLLASTASFCVLCGLNILWSYHKKEYLLIYLFFGLEVWALLTFFVITGIPDGFSALWILMIPAFSLLIFGMKGGSFFSVLTFLWLIFWLWLPLGRSLLRYPYSPTWMLRFPFLYTAIYGTSLFIEFVRLLTARRMHELEDWYKEQYRHDALTNLLNRYGINEYLSKLYQSGEEAKLSVLVADIDDFKRVNDRYGHNAGDAVLRTVAKIMEQEACPHCRCARWGGEEFLVVMQCGHDPMQLAQRIRQRVASETVVYEGSRVQVTVSIGVCVGVSTADAEADRIINAADKALYAAKEQGKNMVLRGDL